MIKNDALFTRIEPLTLKCLQTNQFVFNIPWSSIEFLLSVW